MSRLQLALNVADIDEAIGDSFYEALRYRTSQSAPWRRTSPLPNRRSSWC